MFINIEAHEMRDVTLGKHDGVVPGSYQSSDLNDKEAQAL